jgi:hypothetical protein
MLVQTQKASLLFQTPRGFLELTNWAHFGGSANRLRAARLAGDDQKLAPTCEFAVPSDTA